jgi:Flp pilus assembly protein TadG
MRESESQYNARRPKTLTNIGEQLMDACARDNGMISRAKGGSQQLDILPPMPLLPFDNVVLPHVSRAMAKASRHRLSGAGARRHQSGAALVEFAIVLPLLLLLVFGIVEFGLILYDKAVITNASREAARAGIVYNPTSPNYLSASTIQSNATNNLAPNLISLGAKGTPWASVPAGCATTGDALTVTVSYTYTGLALGVDRIMGTAINPLADTPNNLLTMSATTTMRCE